MATRTFCDRCGGETPKDGIIFIEDSYNLAANKEFAAATVKIDLCEGCRKLFKIVVEEFLKSGKGKGSVLG